MAEIKELQRLYELFKVAKGNIPGVDIMVDGTVGEVDNSFKGWAKYFMGYPKRWRALQFERFGIK